MVPTFNEAERIEDTLRSLRAGGLESIVVVDGGSRDGTRELAARHADRVLEVERGLAGQLDLAAREAKGDVLLFQYADVRFPKGGGEAILKALESRDVVGGAFSLALDSTRLCYRLIALGARVRNRLGVGPFGDQSLFVRTEVYRRIGG
ncbi:MAG TPA: glycosyltransferase, partial [Planctomycetota bacterium]|nr:glycosyltransferase [Planctomycetota bacterium]